MSIILNALKKSEAQRRLGKSPTLAETAAISSAPETRRRISPWWFTLALLLLLATGWFARDLINSEPADAQPAQSGGATQVPQQTADQKPGTALDEVAGEAREAFGQASEPVQLARPMNRTTTALSTPVESYTAPPPDPAPEAVTEEPAESSKIEPQDRTAIITARAQPARSVGTEPLTIYEIPRDIRASLPELKISLQVYDADPENRFAVVNGLRYKEGAELGSGLVLSEILQRGLVFTYRDYRFVVGQ